MRNTEGDWTIGWGHKLTDAEITAGSYKNGITRAEADESFIQDVQNHIDGVWKNVTNASSLTQNQFDALVSVSYNSGRNGLLSSLLVKEVKSHGEKISSPDITDSDEFQKAIATAFSNTRMPKPDKPAYQGVLERRSNECRMFLFGDYIRDPTPKHLKPIWKEGIAP